MLSSHGREIGTQDALKKESQGLSQVAAGLKNPPANAGDLGSMPGLGRSPGEGKEMSREEEKKCQGDIY